MATVPITHATSMDRNAIVGWLGRVNRALRRPIPDDIASGHVAFARMVEWGIEKLSDNPHAR